MHIINFNFSLLHILLAFIINFPSIHHARKRQPPSKSKAITFLKYLRQTMASENATKTVNGNYGNHQSYGNTEQSVPSQPSISSTAGTTATGNFGEDATSVSNAGNSSTTGASDSGPGVPKDEVGWYFVEQYYTTLSKTPEKLHVRKPVAPAEKIRRPAFLIGLD